jgi:hypothetical protein
MHMKQLALFLACLAAGSASIQAQTPQAASDKMAKIEEMFQITKPEQMLQQMMQQMHAVQAAQLEKTNLTPEKKAQAEQAMQKMSRVIEERLSWVKLKPIYVKIYDEIFTADELSGIVAFYKSPAGRAMIEKMPVLMSKAMAAVQQQMGDVMQQMQQVVKEGEENK